MFKSNAKKPIIVAMGAALAGSVYVADNANAAENPFGLTELSGGYMQTSQAATAEGKCGEGKCGGTQASTSADKPGGTKGSASEGKCGEGKCGGTQGSASEGKCGRTN